MTTDVRPTPSVMTTRDLGPAPEQAVARDLVKHGLIALPIGLVLGAVGWGVDGAISVGYAFLLVLANFALAAALLGWAARQSYGLLMAVSLFGFLVRMALIFGAVLLVKDQPWFEVVPLCIALVATHLGLLFWETKYVSASLAFPGLKPSSEEH